MARVRGNGSTIQLDDTKKTSEKQAWELRVSIGRDLATNKYPTMTRRFHGTLTEAKKALRDFINEIERGEVQRRSTMRFGEYCDAWIEERKLDRAWGTVRRDSDRLKNARIHLENARLHEITPEVLEALYKSLLNGESVSGRKLSSNYVASIATVMHTLFKQAVKDKHIASNPCDYAERPKIVRKERNSIRAESIKTLLEKLDAKDPLQLVIIIALKTGMRRGEIHGLSWNDIDFENRLIHIRHNFADNGELKEPKTENGYREIPLPESLIADLEVRRLKMISLAKRYKIEIPDDAPIICNGFLERMLPHSSTRWWDKNRAELGFPDLTIHELRHSFLSEMARRKVDPKVLQKLAGHAKYSTTMDIYTHVDIEDKREAMRKMDW